MSLTRFLKRLVYGGATALRDYEAACVREIRDQITPRARTTLDAQVSAIELIQRFADDKLTAFHLRSLGSGERFPNRGPELHAATFVVGAPDIESVGGRLVLHDGRLSTLEFDRSPKGFRRQHVFVSDVWVRDDLMVASDWSTAPDEPPSNEALAAALPGLHATSVLSPASQSERDVLLTRLKTSVPDDYRTLLAATDGFAASDWLFLGTRVRTLAAPATTYIIAAEREDSTAALCFRAGQRSPIVVLYDEIDDEEKATYVHFGDALEQVAGASSR